MRSQIHSVIPRLLVAFCPHRPMKEVDLRPFGDCKGSAGRVENKIYFIKSANNQRKKMFLELVVGVCLWTHEDFFCYLCAII